MKKSPALFLTAILFAPSMASPNKYVGPDGKLRIALSKQPFAPNRQSEGPDTMAGGGLVEKLEAMGAVVRVSKAALTEEEDTEYGGWKRLGMALGHYGETIARNERDGYFSVGLFASCPSLPGMLAGLQNSGPPQEPLKVGLLWLDAHPDYNTPETTRSGSLGGMPVAVAAGKALHGIRLDAGLDPPIAEKHIVMAGVRLTDPLEQHMLDNSFIEVLGVEPLRDLSADLFGELDRLHRTTDKLYVHIDMDVLDPKEVEFHGNAVPNGVSSEELARLFEEIFKRYAKASAIGFATIPSRDPDGLALAAVHRMILGAVKGLKARE
ncbi:MAG TPA: arginase family protein [Vicinamibacteria bacterium]|nr:arginase family protein [Vicinamibacteria bacterium]